MKFAVWGSHWPLGGENEREDLMKEETMIGRGLRADTPQVGGCAGEPVGVNKACDAQREMTPVEIGLAAERRARIERMQRVRAQLEAAAAQLQELERSLPFTGEPCRRALEAAEVARLWMDEAIREMARRN